MNIVKKIYCRVVQNVLKVGMYLIHFPSPELVSGEDSILKVKDILKANNKNRVLVVTDNNLLK